MQRLAIKESIAPSQQSSADWKPKSVSRCFVRVGRRHSVTMPKASFKIMS